MRALTATQVRTALKLLRAEEGQYVSFGGTGRIGAGFAQHGRELFRVEVGDDLSGPRELAVSEHELEQQLRALDLDAPDSAFATAALRELGLALPRDPLDGALCAAVDALLDTTSLWYGSGALLVRNFDNGETAVVHRDASESPLPSRLAAARAALQTLAPGDPRALAEAMSAASFYTEPHEPMAFEPIAPAAAAARLEEHLARCQTAAFRSRGSDVLAPLAGHSLWILGDRRYRQVETTAIFAHSSSRAVLIEYLGDGP